MMSLYEPGSADSSWSPEPGDSPHGDGCSADGNPRGDPKRNGIGAEGLENDGVDVEDALGTADPEIVVEITGSTQPSACRVGVAALVGNHRHGEEWQPDQKRDQTHQDEPADVTKRDGRSCPWCCIELSTGMTHGMPRT